MVMSSTSSSSCHGSCFLEDSSGRLFNPGASPVPYYSVTQPLVYYAEVQPCCQMPVWGGQPRRENTNCFVRAFRWYTQEREPENRRTVKPELTGFATWLDSKYGEYVREKELNQEVYVHQSQRNATITPTTCQPNPPVSVRRFSRMKSPWCKRRGACKTGNAPCKISNPSCEYILQPKDLTRPTSECLYQTIAPCRNKSITTVLSTEIEGTNRITVKSRSLTNMNCEKHLQNANNISVSQGCTNKAVEKGLNECEIGLKVQTPLKSKRLSVCSQNYKTEQDYKIPATPARRSLPVDQQSIVKQVSNTSLRTQILATPCDQSCKSKLEYKTLEENRPLPAKSPSPSCDQNRMVKQSRAMVDESQRHEMSCECDQTNVTKQESYIIVPLKSQQSNICDCNMQRVCKMPTVSQRQETLNEPGVIKQESRTSVLVKSQTVSKVNEVNKIPQKLEKSCIQQCMIKQGRCITEDQIGHPSQNSNVSPVCDCTAKLDHLIKIERRRVSAQLQTSSAHCDCKPESKIQAISPIVKTVDVECQCPEENTMRADAQVQWEYPEHTFDSTCTNDLCRCVPVEQLYPSIQVATTLPSQSSKSYPVSSHYPKKPKRAPRKVDVSCQCPEENVVKFDMACQCDHHDFEIQRDVPCVCIEPGKPTCTCVKVTNDCSARNLLSAKITTYSLTKFRNDAVQTSDHSITLERDDDRNYAFFMKIVCADRLNDCGCE